MGVMAEEELNPISQIELRRRKQRILQIARQLGFVGRVEYRHVCNQSGGAQYGRGSDQSVDLLTVTAQAFERGRDPDDFTLEAIIAHERGHQIIARHRKLAQQLGGVSGAAEEVLASLIGALVLGPGYDSDTLVAKALAELLATGTSPEDALRLVESLIETLEEYL